MFNSWKSQLLQPLGRGEAGRKPPGGAGSENPEEDPQVLRLRRMLADLRGGDVEEAACEVTSAETTIFSEAVEDEESASASRADATLAAMLSLLAKQRELAEALLRECRTLEERLQTEAMATQADREYAAATEKANAATLLGRQTKEIARAASERRKALAAERKTLDELVATARSEAQSAKVQVADAEERLREARQLAEELSAMLAKCEIRARECAANESAAAAEETEAAELIEACETAVSTAGREAQNAKERAETLKRKRTPVTQSFARISDIEDLAMRIARSSAAYKSP